MKFGEELLSQMVPEWQHAYVDYESLKKILEAIKLTNSNTPTLDGAKNHHGGGLNRIMAQCSTFCGLFSSPLKQRRGDSHDVEGGLQMTVTTGPILTPKFRMGEEEGGENENKWLFMQRIGSEFTKVSKFYQDEVKKATKEEEMLMGKMHDLIEVAPAADISASTPADAVAKSMITEEGEASKAGHDEEDNEARGSVGEVNTSRVRAERPAPVDIHDGVTSNDTSENRKKKSMQKLREDFVVFYQKLLLLKSYSFMNVKAFSKIMKKYDKITSSDERMSFMTKVDDSYLGSSDEVERLIERVENSFVKHIAKSNRTEGMNILRPKVIRERHRLTFSTGFSAGCLFSLIVALAAIIRTRNILQEAGQEIYMNTMFPLYSFFGFIVLHIIMYAVNIYYWRRYRINYSFIFQFKQGTELGYKQILLLAFSTGVFALLCVLANLDMEVDPETKDYQIFTELLPLILLLVMFLVIIMPFKLFYYTNRYFFLVRLYHCLAAPLFKVTFPDFFLGDQLTSQVQAFRSIEFYICYYGWGDFRHRNNTCDKSGAYKGFFFIVAVIPYVSRLLQCLRRLFEEKKPEQGWNGLKYFLTIVAVCLRTAYSIQQGHIVWRVLAIIFSVAAAIFGTYWDFVHDWGLLNRTSKNPWLREKLLIPQKKVYFIAMILNVLLRFAWIQTVLDFKVSFMHEQTLITVVASLEIIRRGIWNFFRLENEQLNNVGKYRPFKSVPQASNYGGKKDD